MATPGERPRSNSPAALTPYGRAFIHLAGIGAAITAALLIAQIPNSAAWLFAMFAATLLYLGVSSVEVATVERGGGATASGK